LGRIASGIVRVASARATALTEILNFHLATLRHSQFTESKLNRNIALFLITICLALESIASSPNQPSRDLQLSKNIIGSWTEGNSTASFLVGGGYKAVIYAKDNKTISMTAEGTWWIKAGMLYNRIEESQPPSVPRGSVYIDTIVDISPNTMTLIDSKGLQYTKKKTP
jgi:hypothetical protein